MEGRILEYIALGMLTVISITFLYVIIYIHDIPYEIAKKRNHPHQDAIHTAGWISLFLMHTIWPFLWIWATLYKPDVGWGMETIKLDGSQQGDKKQAAEIAALKSRVAALEKRIVQPEKEV
jgi:uncharacterized protein DUF3302